MREMRTSASTSALFAFAGIPRQPLYPFRSGPIVASDAISSELKKTGQRQRCATTVVVAGQLQGWLQIIIKTIILLP